ncbi:xanthine dehydrogenase family protein molybdopterin-binding subunit [Dehalobacterium formicoaceticum]|uniref:Molybdopterin-dependent oxidoreductase n=1 Tax=Dehalobacterium formicoaceticum TaxID=51515 RepID=A0ABT1Y4P4_9FIRM|nr:molybdopterin cofactor-binding domain-containing protein [Dehalobacterium formicoaceticum]MCR6545110.1 molybdopterin-dependent oxidoreductase [Dehalobacterium formicoaceticum]
MKAVSNSIPKIDGMAIATGKPVYTDDLAMDHALIIKILRSPHAFARIKSIDVREAQHMEGVECVLTYQDVPKVRFTTAGQSYPEPSPCDRLILDEYVRFVGDGVAIIAARDEKTAIAAMKVIKVEYEVLNPVLDFEQAVDHDSLIHPEKDLHVNFDIGLDQEKNIAATCRMGAGDVEEELAQSDLVLERTYFIQAQAHCMMETYRAFSYLDQQGRLVVVSSTQVPFHAKRMLARALELPKNRVRVVKPRIGGGFGGKQTSVVDVYPAIVTIKTGKPCKIVYERQETFSSSNSRQAMRIKVKIGAMASGIIRAIDLEALADTGAYGEHAPTVFKLVGLKTLPLYNQAKGVRYRGTAVYTNKMPGGAFRGYGAPQGTFAVESAVNELAQELGMDAALLREMNLIQEGETNPILDGPEEEKPITLTSCTLDRCVEQGKKLIGWEAKSPFRRINGHKVRGLGMAVTMQGSGIAGVDMASALIKLNEDGYYTLMIGSTDMGTGSDTILAQMAAEVLETTVDKIVVHGVDTDISPYDPGSYASSTTYVTGNAVIRAAEKLKEQIRKKGAHFLDVSADQVEFDGMKVKTLDDDKSISLDDLVLELMNGRDKDQLFATGSFGGKTSPPPFIAGFAEVEVDVETGKVDLIEFVAVIDCGTVINPNLARVQAEGGLVQGIGLALFEDVKYSEGGKLQTDSFMQYKIPCRKDVGKITVEFAPSFESSGPFGAKSIGEVVVNTAAPAIAHAVFNATGVFVRDLPITPEKVFFGMKQNSLS